jgi:hypothetical protein
LSGEALTSQVCRYGGNDLLPVKNNNRSDNLAQTGSKLSQTPAATHPVDRRKQLLHRNQQSMKTTSELLLVTDDQSDQGKQD